MLMGERGKRSIIFHGSLLLLVSVLMYLGATPLFERLIFLNQAEQPLYHTANQMNRIICFEMPKQDPLAAVEKINHLLSTEPEFSGFYLYPDLHVITSVTRSDSGQTMPSGVWSDSKVEDFIPYVFPKNLEFFSFVSIKKGEMFSTQEDGEPLPIVVTENSSFQIGDQLKLNLNVSNDNEVNYPNAEPLAIDAVVCGIANEQVFLPFVTKQYLQNDFYEKHYQKPVFFIPPIDDYLAQFDYAPRIYGQSKLKGYLLLNQALSEERHQYYAEKLSGYGVIDYEEWSETFGNTTKSTLLHQKNSLVLYPLLIIGGLYLIFIIFSIKTMLHAVIKHRK